MNKIKKIIYGISSFIDFFAGLILIGVAALVVSNILMRTIFNNPVLGTYEMVGYLTASAIALSLANCAVQNSHIAVGFLIDRLPVFLRKMAAVFVNLISLIFLSYVSWFLLGYAQTISLSGRVSNTLQIPFYPFVYVLAFGFIVLSLIIFIRLSESFSIGGDN